MDRQFAVSRGEACSDAYVEAVNAFGLEGGFDRVEKRLERETEAEEVFRLLKILAMPHYYYHLGFVKGKLSHIVNLIIQFMLKVSEEQLRTIKREKLDQVFRCLELLAGRVYTVKSRTEIMLTTKVSIALALLDSELLERRIQGVRIVSDLCKATKSCPQLSRSVNKVFLSRLLQVPKVVEEIFGKRSHVQLIQRSTDILAFVMSNGSLTEKELEVIWSCYGRDEQLKVEVFKVIADTQKIFPEHALHFIIGKYRNFRKEDYKDQEIMLLLELSQRLSKTEGGLMPQVIRTIWDIVTGKLGSPTKEAYEKAIEKFCYLITATASPSNITTDKYFKKVIEMMKSVF